MTERTPITAPIEDFRNELRGRFDSIETRLDAVDIQIGTLLHITFKDGIELSTGARFRCSEREAIRPDGTPAHLHPAEWKVLEVLSAAPGNLVSHMGLHALWPYAEEPANCLRVAVARIRRELGKEAVQNVPATGYRLGVKR